MRKLAEKVPVGVNISAADILRVIAQMPHDAQYIIVRTVMEDWPDRLCARIIAWLEDT